MKRSHRLITLLSVLTFSVSAAWSDDLIAAGIKAFRAGDYSNAEQLYRRALDGETDTSRLASIYRNMSVLYNAQGKDGSEFSKKADELDPPLKAPNTLRDRSGSELMINSPQTIIPPAAQSQAQPLQYSGTSAGVFMQSQNSGFSAGTGGFGARAGGMSVGVGGFGGSGFRPGANVDPNSNLLNGNGYFGYRSPNGVFEYSDSSTIVLPKPNGGAVIFNAPGPNINSTTQAPDGSTTTIIKRTY